MSGFIDRVTWLVKGWDPARHPRGPGGRFINLSGVAHAIEHTIGRPSHHDGVVSDKPTRRTKSYWAEQLRTAHAGPGFHTIESTPSSRAAMRDELTRQGMEPNHPLRGVLENYRGSHTLFHRDAAGNIDAGVHYHHEKRDKELHLMDVRVVPKRQGIGTQALIHLAREHPDHTMRVYGAVEPAKPWYARTGADITHRSSLGEWDADAMAALRAGTPQAKQFVTEAQDKADWEAARQAFGSDQGRFYRYVRARDRGRAHQQAMDYAHAGRDLTDD